EATVHEETAGVLLRLGDAPRSPAELGGAWPLPPQLTYSHKPRWVRHRDGTTSQVTAIQDDPAPVIPSISRRVRRTCVPKGLIGTKPQPGLGRCPDQNS